MGLRGRFYQTRRVITTPSHPAGTTWSQATIRRENWSSVLGSYGVIFSPSRSMWLPKSTNASGVHNIKPQEMLFRDSRNEHPNIHGLRPRASCTKVSSRIKRAYPDAVSGSMCPLGFLLGHPAATSGLAIVTNAPVLMITRHGLSRIQPWASRLSSALSAII